MFPVIGLNVLEERWDVFVFLFQLTFSSSSIAIRHHLMNFDPRFSALLKRPVKIDYNKPPPAVLKLEKSSKQRKRSQDSSEESPIPGMDNKSTTFIHSWWTHFYAGQVALWISVCIQVISSLGLVDTVILCCVLKHDTFISLPFSSPSYVNLFTLKLLKKPDSVLVVTGGGGGKICNRLAVIPSRGNGNTVMYPWFLHVILEAKISSSSILSHINFVTMQMPNLPISHSLSFS